MLLGREVGLVTRRKSTAVFSEPALKSAVVFPTAAVTLGPIRGGDLVVALMTAVEPAAAVGLVA